MPPSPKTCRRAPALTLAICAAAVLGALAMPAVGQADTTFGSPLTDEPNSGGSNPSTLCPNPPDTSSCTRVGVKFPSADVQDQKAPIAGVVTKFRIRSLSPDKVRFAIARLTEQQTGALATLVGLTDVVTLKGDESVEEFPAQIPVQPGDRVALETTGAIGALHGGSGGKRQYRYQPPLVVGEGPRDSTDDEDEELLVQAAIEPDSDGDGFGDITQDRCPTDNATAGPCPTPDNGKPILSGVALAPGSFRAAGSGGPVQARAPIGSRVFYQLSETATVTWSIDKGTVGRLVGGRCVRTTRANRGRRHCVRYTAMAGSFTTVGAGGQNGFRFSGRLRGRKLQVGSYRLVGTAKDPAGNVSKTSRRNFRIVR